MTKSTKTKLSRTLLLLFFFALFCCLNGCGSSGGGSNTPTTGTGTTTTAAKLDLSASSTTVKSDGSTTTMLTVTALNASNAAVSGVTVTMGADTGILWPETVVTDSTGKGTVTFSSGGNPVNRTATITATSGTVSAQIPVQIVGSTLTMTSTGTQLPDNGTSPVTLTVTAKNASGSTVQNAAVTLTKSGAGNVTITPASGVTLANGTFTATVAGAAGGDGTATLTATALGATATTALTVTPTFATFSIDQQTLNGTVIANNNTTAMKIGDSLAIQVNAPSPTANVTFATTTGVWNGTTNSVVSVPVNAAGKANATLTTTQAGVASVQVYDTANQAASDTLTVAMTSKDAISITLQATPSVVPKSVGSTTGSSTLIAMARGAGNSPVGDAPVSFSILNPTGGGETISPVVVMTAATTSGGLNLGEARTSFSSGSVSSGQGGVQIRASVVGTTVETGTTPSGNDATVVIGGTAGSIAFGQATELSVNDNKTAYILAMSVLVADSNGNPAPAGTQVNLSAWPIAWSTGTDAPCAPDSDDGVGMGTFLNEDGNENLILDSGEDGNRTYYAGSPAVRVGTKDTYLTPTNSAGGTVPATVTTDASGVAAFNLTYPKDSAIWTIVRIRASTIVQGSETVAQTIFRLDPLKADVEPDCKLSCPYVF